MCRYLPGNLSEPNNLQGSEACVAANYTQTKLAQDIQAASVTFNGTGAVSGAWAWADSGCKAPAASICKLLPPLAAPRFSPASSNATFQLLLGSFNFSSAQAACNDVGGHLASWGSQREQVGTMGLIAAVTMLARCYMLSWIGTLRPCCDLAALALSA